MAVRSVEPVRSPRNPRVAAAARLHRARDRAAAGRTLIEGPHVLGEALESAAIVHEVFALESDLDGPAVTAARNRGIAVTPVGQTVLDRLSGTEHPRGPIAVLSVPPRERAHTDVVAVGVNEPGNAGTLIRSAAAFEFAVASLEGSVDLWSPKVLRAAAGGHFHTSIVDANSLGDHQLVVGVPVGGCSSRDLADLVEPSRPVAVMIGNEAHGVASEWQQAADVLATIPHHPHVESLNAAVAGAIIMYELAARRPASEQESGQ